MKSLIVVFAVLVSSCGIHQQQQSLHGHLFTSTNTYITADSKKVCVKAVIQYHDNLVSDRESGDLFERGKSVKLYTTIRQAVSNVKDEDLVHSLPIIEDTVRVNFGKDVESVALVKVP